MKMMDAGSMRSEASRRADKIIEWTKSLIRFASENRPPDGNEGPLQQFIANECSEQGWEVDVFAPDEIPGIREHPSWLPGRSYAKGRKNVVARWRGTGGGKSILLSGHSDVAPFEPDDWQVCRPFEPKLVDKRLYGRGAADMKGGMAAAFWALCMLREMGFEPGGELLFESVVDEEFASGNGKLAARLRGHNADLSVLMEPTRMQVCPACMGAFLGDLTIRGSPGMPYMGSALPNPVNAAAHAIRLFSAWQDAWRAQSRHPLFDAPGSELNTLVWRIDSTRPGEFTQMGTPLSTSMSWIVWCYPGMTEEEFRAQFGEYWREHADDPEFSGIDLRHESTYHFVKPWETPTTDLGVRTVIEAFRECAGEEPTVAGAPFSCDLAVHGEQGGMPCVLLGPGGGNLHAPDEWVDTDDIVSLAAILASVVSSWCRE